LQDGLIRQRQKAAQLLVVLLDAAGEDVVVPAVDGEAAFGESVLDGGLGAEIGELSNDVAANERGQLSLIAVGGVERLAIEEGGLDMLEPAAGLGQIHQAGVVDGGLQRATVGVAAEDGVLHLQDFDGVFDGRRAAVHIIGGGGHDVAGVAGDEQIAGPGAEKEIGDDARVRAGDEEKLRRLRLGQKMKLIAAEREDLLVKMLVSCDQTIHAIPIAP